MSTPRLPISGQDKGTWGNILNTFLKVEHNNDGTLKNVVRPSSLSGLYTKPNTGIPASDLDSSTQTALTSVASKYTKPASGIPSSDMTTGVQSSLTAADTAVQTVNGKAGAAVTLAASDIDAVGVGSLVLNVQDYGAKGDGTTDDTSAIQDALADAATTGKPVYFPSTGDAINTPYKITAPLDLTSGNIWLIGDAQNGSGIQMVTANTQILKVGGAQGGVERLTLSYSSQPSGTDTTANAIEFYNADHWTFRDLHIYQTGRAFYIPQAAVGGTGQNTCFSCSFENIWINHYSINAINFQSFNGASTGSVWSNIYTFNGYTATGGSKGGGIASADAPVRFQKCDEQIISQLNIEGVNCTVTDALMFNACDNIQITGLHFENIGLSSFGIGFINPFGDTRIGIHGMSIHFSDINTTGGGSRYVFRTGGTNVHMFVQGVSIDSTNTVTNSTFPIVSSGATGGAITVIDCDTTGTTALTNYTTVSVVTPLKRINDTYYHRLDGGKNVVYGTAAPTTGTWAVGDRCNNTAPTVSGTAMWICTSAGTPGTWTALTLG